MKRYRPLYDCPVTTLSTGYGLHVYPNGDVSTKSLKAYGFSPQFIRIFRFAINQGYYAINFDRDSAEYKELKTFNW